MTDPTAIPLADRGVLRISGPDARSFLQGIVSNDVEQASESHAIWSAFLTPQGKYLHDFFLVESPLAEEGGALLLEGERERLPDLMKRLRIYKLRSKAEVEDVSESHAVFALLGDAVLKTLELPEAPGAATPFGGGVAFADPRLAAAGARAVLPAESAAQTLQDAGFLLGTHADYDRVRIPLGLPDGSRDMEIDKAILLENGFDELQGVDWKKGCFLGQELTARTKYRGLVKKRLLPVEIEGHPPEGETAITRDGKEVGELRSHIDGWGLALLRLQQIEDLPPGGLALGDAKLTPKRPAWFAPNG
ncbi:MAG: folate-binding protein [Rhodovibrionaceae bacterium]